MQKVESAESSGMMNTRYDITNMEIPDMLDAFIISKIQRERELHESDRESLRIDTPREPTPKPEPRSDETTRERGVEIVDFNI